MIICLFLLIAVYILTLGVGGIVFLWYGIILLRDKVFFTSFFGIFIIAIGVFFFLASIGISVTLIVVGLKF